MGMQRKTYDWLVVGGGLTGAMLGYELARAGFAIALLEQQFPPHNATRYSYGGIAFWSGTDRTVGGVSTRQLCREGRDRYDQLCEELPGEIAFRELDLLLTIAPNSDPQQVAQSYTKFAIPPQLLDVQQACELEPLLNPNAIAGALTVRHGHVHPEKLVLALYEGIKQLGGELICDRAVDLQRESDRIRGVRGVENTYTAKQTAICVGGMARAFLAKVGIHVPIYFTHAEAIETPPANVQLRTLVMPAALQRIQLEAKATQPQAEPLWKQPGNEPVPAILDTGAVQFLDGSFRLGQISRVLTDPQAKVNLKQSEAGIRASIGQILPSLATLPGRCRRCLVAFSRDGLPLVGELDGFEGISLFAGFSNPFVLVPALAQRFARHAAGKTDEIISQLSPSRL
jgi:glycine/D-amino acid oxidase-like deaminating enzyme